MRKVVFGMPLSLMLIGMLLTFNTISVEAAAAAVYIRSNGSVYPSTAPIQRNGDVYTLTDNIIASGDGIWIERNNVILDGAGYAVQGSGQAGSDGIYLRERNNVTIRNLQIMQFGSGIFSDSSSNINVSSCIITANSDYGIWLLVSPNSNIKNNTLASNYYAGIYMYSSPNSIISENNISTNGYYGITIYSSLHNSITKNLITETHNGNGISLGYLKHSSISGNLIVNNWRGIMLWSSSHNTISGNNITLNDDFGIDISGSSYNSIVGNNIDENNGNGIWLSGSSDNVMCGNNIANNIWGISLDSSSNNFIYHNNFVNNAQQVYFHNFVNVWDDGYPSGGNYWSDYLGIDANGDGIGDSPYVIDADNVDKYPLMKVLMSTVYLSPSIINTDEGTTFNVSIVASRFENLWAWQAGIQWDPTLLEYVSCTWGEFQTFAGASERSLLTIDSISGKTSRPALESALRGWFAPLSMAEVKLLTITFKVLRAGTSPLRLVDISLRSLNLTSTTVYPRFSDVNGDGVVNTEDIEFVFQCWEGSYYDQAADFNDDSLVDITDISIVTSDFSKTNTDPEWGVTNTTYDIPAATVGAQVRANPAEANISVPHHFQHKSYYCGPAALEMVFDFYGPDIYQTEIADAARTASSYGTYTFDMVRAAHFSNLSISVGKESKYAFQGYNTRKLGYAAFERWGMTIDDVKSLIVAGYPIIVLTTWHFRVVVGYDSTHIIFQDSLYGPMYKMTYNDFIADWDYSGHWGLLVTPWNVEISNARNVLPGDVFTVTATITYPWASPFPEDQYPAIMANATITLPPELALTAGETAKKVISMGDLVAGDSVNVTWTMQAQTLGNYAISVEAEGKIFGFVPPVPPDYPEYFYEDRIGGVGQSIVVVTSSLDESPPTTTDDYDGQWHQSFRINLTAVDNLSGTMETYYRINDGQVKILSLDGQPYISTEGSNNTLEYWSEDWAGNQELPHKFLSGIKLDKTMPVVGSPSRVPSGDVESGEEVKVAVGVTDVLSGVKSVTLLYTINDGVSWGTKTMSYDASIGLYAATIPGYNVGTVVKYKIVALDNAGNMAVKDNSGQYYTYQVQGYYMLTVTSTTGGTINPPPGTHYIWSGAMASATATPRRGYKFDHWELDGANISSSSTFAFRMDKNHSLKAVFQIIPPPIGGHSYQTEGQPTIANPLIHYATIVVIVTSVFTLLRRGRFRQINLKDYVYNLLHVS